MAAQIVLKQICKFVSEKLECLVMVTRMSRTGGTSSRTSESGRGESLPLVAYVRVSTQQQAEQGMGLEVQRAEIGAWAEREGRRIGRWDSG